jgi:pimeloyl-ACP methyl ester carboxylesterase
MQETFQSIKDPGRRRGMVAAALTAGLGAASLAGCATTRNLTAAEPKTFVLLPPGWAGGWIYHQTATVLRAQGHVVYTPTLTGLGKYSHLLRADVNLDTHIADVLGLLKWEELKDVVLVGHSFSGAVVSGVAEKALEKLSAVVMVNGYMHENGWSVQDYLGPRSQTDITARVGKGEAGLPPPPASLYALPPEHAVRANALLSRHPLGAMTQKSELTGALEKVPKKTYVMLAKFARGREFELVHFKRAQSLPGWKTVSAELGHLAMLDSPDAFSQLLLSAA